ncbi:hypothetical protein TNCV_494021 [Trichonephila clavipes]|nr:hypothetical protein TNCV_494021 [Trichonephila clavipes]
MNPELRTQNSSVRLLFERNTIRLLTPLFLFNSLSLVIEEIFDLSRQINLEVDSSDILELLDSHKQELTINELIEMHEHDIKKLGFFDPIHLEDRMKDTLNSLRVASPLVRLVEGEGRWEISDPPEVLSLKIGMESSKIVLPPVWCSKLKANGRLRNKSLAAVNLAGVRLMSIRNETLSRALVVEWYKRLSGGIGSVEDDKRARHPRRIARHMGRSVRLLEVAGKNVWTNGNFSVMMNKIYARNDFYSPCHSSLHNNEPEDRQWCLARTGWNHAHWGCIVFSDKSCFQLFSDDVRRRVCRRPGQQDDSAFPMECHTGPQPNVMV